MSETQNYTAWRPAVLTAVVAPTVGLCLFGVIVAFVSREATASEIFDRAVLSWLFVGGSSLQIDGKTIGIVPLGAMVILGAVNYFVAAWSIRGAPVDPKVFAPVAAGVAGAIAAILAAIVSTETVAVPMFRAAAVTFLFVGSQAAIAAFYRGNSVWFGMPSRWWPVAEGAASILMVFFGLATLLVLILLATSLQDSANMWATLYPQGQGVILALFMVLAFPTAVLWTGAVLLGTPLSLGSDAYVNLAATHVERLPILPLLSAIPEPGPHPAWVMVLGAVPLLAGFSGGSYMRHRTTQELDWDRVLKDAVITGVAAGLAGTLLIATSAGGVGPGALNTAGPSVWLVLFVSVAVFTLGAVLGASAAHYRLTRVRT